MRGMLFVLMLVASATSAAANVCTMPTAPRRLYSHYSGNAVRPILEEPQFDTLVTGIADGIAMGVSFMSSEECGRQFINCIANRPASQLGAIVRKQMNAAPEQWNYDFTMIVYNAIFAPCVK